MNRASMISEFEKAGFHAHNSHHYIIAVYINKQFRQVLVLKVARAAFAVAGLSDVHECSGDLQMAPSFLSNKTASYN